MEYTKLIGASEYDEEIAMRVLDLLDAVPAFARDNLLQAQKKVMYVRLMELSGKEDMNLEGSEPRVMWYKPEGESVA